MDLVSDLSRSTCTPCSGPTGRWPSILIRNTNTSFVGRRVWSRRRFAFCLCRGRFTSCSLVCTRRGIAFWILMCFNLNVVCFISLCHGNYKSDLCASTSYDAGIVSTCWIHVDPTSKFAFPNVDFQHESHKSDKLGTHVLNICMLSERKWLA